MARLIPSYRPELTEVPSNMTLGATWDTNYAYQTGLIVGKQLSTLGVNMVFGPMLDVVDKPRPDLGNTIGVRSFGGDPYWVGNMGRAYIQGLHVGSADKIQIIAKHFPGAGGIDRPLNQDIPTIQKSLVQLQQNELAPFYEVTTVDDADTGAKIDGLMTAHIRYRGLQGNIRELTQPISLDTQKLPLILLSPEIAPWHQQGGLVVSGPLGAPALVKAYQTDTDVFPARRIALDAFLAGNDILLLDGFSAPDSMNEQFNNIMWILSFFEDTYQNDPDFQQLVDTAVKKILKAKLTMYDDFSIEKVQKIC